MNSLEKAGSIHETQFSKPMGGGGGDGQSAVLVPIDEDKQKGEGEEDEEEGPEEVALDWWSKYFASKG